MLCEHVVRSVPGRGSKRLGLPVELAQACLRLHRASAAGVQEARKLTGERQILWDLGRKAGSAGG